MLGTVGLELFFKGAVGRLRPEFVPHPSADSFPSGHTLAAAILGAGLVVVYLPVCRRAWQRAALFAGGVAWPLLIGLSRIYLGRHYLTDVLGGLLLGVAWVLGALALSLVVSRACARRTHTAPEPELHAG
jgi:undecaprenyl-diphosphatase